MPFVMTCQHRRLFIRDAADPNSADSNRAFVARPSDGAPYVRGGSGAKGENATKAPTASASLKIFNSGVDELKRIFHRIIRAYPVDADTRYI